MKNRRRLVKKEMQLFVILLLLLPRVVWVEYGTTLCHTVTSVTRGCVSGIWDTYFVPLVFHVLLFITVTGIIRASDWCVVPAARTCWCWGVATFACRSKRPLCATCWGRGSTRRRESRPPQTTWRLLVRLPSYWGLWDTSNAADASVLLGILGHK